ncbi:hypothetical protein PLICRDRAFT_384533 [Plicaturopsis crispa FD-325 SS-3]|nr:hypothetical protein PLICRDRAFT_384533 [Plicaturopsis crispa FD-325 SS-3]
MQTRRRRSPPLVTARLPLYLEQRLHRVRARALRERHLHAEGTRMSTTLQNHIALRGRARRENCTPRDVHRRSCSVLQAAPRCSIFLVGPYGSMTLGVNVIIKEIALPVCEDASERRVDRSVAYCHPRDIGRVVAGCIGLFHVGLATQMSR